jgi:flagellar protein FliJ
MFKFSLETVLAHRKHLETMVQKEFVELKHLLNHEIAKHERIMVCLNRTSDDLREKQKSKLTASEAVLHIDYVERLTTQLVDQKRIVDDTKKKVDVKRSEVLAAMKNRKALQKLRDKHYEAYIKKINKAEQNFLNEMGTLRYRPK